MIDISILLDRDRLLLERQDTRLLAGGGADRTGKFGEVVRRVQTIDRVLKVVSLDEVVPFRNQVAEWAARVAEGDAAIHTAAGLLANDFGVCLWCDGGIVL